MEGAPVWNREAPDGPDLVALLAERETYLQALYPGRAPARRAVELLADTHGFYGLRVDGRIVGCGGLIRHSGFMEVKRVFLSEAVRRRGLGRFLMAALEAEATASGCALLRLEVGARQPDAIGLYQRMGYVETGPFPPYRADPVSRFMEKRLKPARPAATP
ncbi:MAG TPA: GNAT family N-acetyltransferase [Phenylobacterium sp.]|nr:GNAT family N-acetyltransferase [Phenylobacterium sp.]